MRDAMRTFSVTPHMCDTSNSDACSRQCFVASMIESLYWIGMDHPANGTILPVPSKTACDQHVKHGPVNRVKDDKPDALENCCLAGRSTMLMERRPCMRQMANGRLVRTTLLDMQVIQRGLQEVCIAREGSGSNGTKTATKH
jgi:hypothetical protein